MCLKGFTRYEPLPASPTGSMVYLEGRGDLENGSTMWIIGAIIWLIGVMSRMACSMDPLLQLMRRHKKLCCTVLVAGVQKHGLQEAKQRQDIGRGLEFQGGDVLRLLRSNENGAPQPDHQGNTHWNPWKLGLPSLLKRKVPGQEQRAGRPLHINKIA